MTLKELNEIAKKVLAAGCMKLGLIEKEDEIDTYYMHGVSHHLGIDVHDVTAACNETLQPLLMNRDFTLTNGKSESVSRMIF